MKPTCSKVPSGSGTSACAHLEIRANKSPKLGAHSGPAKAVCSCNVVVADTAAHESKKKPRRLKSDSFGLNRSGIPKPAGFCFKVAGEEASIRRRDAIPSSLLGTVDPQSCCPIRGTAARNMLESERWPAVGPWRHSFVSRSRAQHDFVAEMRSANL